MPDQGTLLRMFLTTGMLFGLPLVLVALARLRHSRRERCFLLATTAAGALFVGGFLWLLLLLAPPSVPCPPTTPASESPCAMGSVGLHRGWPIVDAALVGLVGLGLVVALVGRRLRRTSTVSIEELLQDVLTKDR